jgi:hypothetical protein
VWSLTAIAARQPGYYEELAAARAGTATTLPITDAILDWANEPPPGAAVTYQAELSGRIGGEAHGAPANPARAAR